MVTRIIISLILISVTYEAYSLDTLQNKSADYLVFFDFPIENIKILSGSGWGGPEEINLKKPTKTILLNKINNCLKSILQDTISLKTSKKIEINITAKDIDSFMVTNPLYYGDDGIPIEEISEWMKDFKKKYLELSEQEFQEIFKTTGVTTYDGPYIEILIFNSKKDKLTLKLESPDSPFYLPTLIFYNSTYIEAKNINISNCLISFFKEANWKYSQNIEKERFITNFIGAMYHLENR